MQARLDEEIADACIACHNDLDIKSKPTPKCSVVSNWLVQHRLSKEKGELMDEDMGMMGGSSPFDEQCQAVCTGEEEEKEKDPKMDELEEEMKPKLMMRKQSRTNPYMRPARFLGSLRDKLSFN